MKQFLASSIVNGNEIQLIKEGEYYFIYFGEQEKPKSIKKLTTPTGRRTSQNSAHRQFMQAVQAAKYLKFSKL